MEDAIEVSLSIVHMINNYSNEMSEVVINVIDDFWWDFFEWIGFIIACRPFLLFERFEVLSNKGLLVFL